MAKKPTQPKSKIVSGTGIAVGGHGEVKTALGTAMEAAMHQAILMGRDKGETDEQIRDRIHAARDLVLEGHSEG